MLRRMLVTALVALGTVAVPVVAQAASKLHDVQHIVVIYEENHSFDNLYGRWEGVRGLANANA